jgi:hypothetical protein
MQDRGQLLLQARSASPDACGVLPGPTHPHSVLQQQKAMPPLHDLMINQASSMLQQLTTCLPSPAAFRETTTTEMTGRCMRQARNGSTKNTSWGERWGEQHEQPGAGHRL